MTNFEPYTDTTLMPFGKYSKKPDGPRALANVPAEWLIWLWDSSDKGERIRDVRLKKYIQDNMIGLRAEANKFIKK